MDDEASGQKDFEWDLRSSNVRAGNKLPIPEAFRDTVMMDSGEEPSTWWGYDKKTGYAFLSSDYTSEDRFITVNNQSYKLEKGSRVTIPKTGNNVVTQGVLSKRPEEGATIYFYTDSRMSNTKLKSVIVLNSDQIEAILEKQDVFSTIADEVSSEERGAPPGTITPTRNLFSDETEDDSESWLDLKSIFPVPK